MQTAEADQPDHHSHDQNSDHHLHRARHYRGPPGFAGRDAATASAIAFAIGAADAVSKSGVGVDTLEISTATAGAVTERNARTGAPVEAGGEPEKACASSPCIKS